MLCEHVNFETAAEIARLTDVEGGPVVGYTVDIRIRCSDCEEPFCFRGLPMGMSQLAPTSSFDGTVLTAPIHPVSDPTTGIGLLGFSVQIRDGDDG